MRTTTSSIMRFAIGGLHSYPALPMRKNSSVRGSVSMGTRGAGVFEGCCWFAFCLAKCFLRCYRLLSLFTLENLVGLTNEGFACPTVEGDARFLRRVVQTFVVRYQEPD